jgi:5-methylthioadenosine/S-adenosylhomocysteine deaminase
VLNPQGNLKMKCGIPPIRALQDAGVRIGLGCDNCSCSDAQNIFQAMKLFTTLPAVSDPADGPPAAADALHAATVGGARTAGLERRIGALREGMRADLTILDVTDPVYVPFNSAARQIVFGEGGRGVDTVIVDGKVVMRERKLLTIDEEALRRELADVIAHFRADAAAVFARTEALRPYIREADRRVWQHGVGLHRFVGR